MERNPIYLANYARETLAAHKIICHEANRGTKGDPNDRRLYQGQCKSCDWIGTKTTGTKALEEMAAHSLATVVAPVPSIPAPEPIAETAPEPEAPPVKKTKRERKLAKV